MQKFVSLASSLLTCPSMRSISTSRMLLTYCLEIEDRTDTLCLCAMMGGPEFIAVYAVYELFDSSWSDETG